MRRWLADRELRRVHTRLQRARARLGEAEAELQVLREQADEDDLRALVSENPLERSEASDTGRHASRAASEVEALREEVSRLQRRLDELLDARPGTSQD